MLFVVSNNSNAVRIRLKYNRGTVETGKFLILSNNDEFDSHVQCPGANAVDFGSNWSKVNRINQRVSMCYQKFGLIAAAFAELSRICVRDEFDRVSVQSSSLIKHKVRSLICGSFVALV